MKRISEFCSKPEMIYLDKYAYSAILMFTHLIYSISFSSFGPAFVDLKYILNTSMQMISLFPTILAVGHVTGTLCGLAYKYLNRQLIITILLLLMAVSSTSVPFTQSLPQYFLCAFAYGIGSGAWMTTYYVWLLEMWQDKSERVLFLSQLIYGIGASLGPIMDAPYLTGEPDQGHNSGNNTHVIKHSKYDIDNSERRAKLMIPFIISGGIQVIFPAILAVMFFSRRYHNQIANLETNKDKTETKLFDKSSKKLKLFVVILSAISLASINSLELVYFNFGTTFFQYIPVRFSASTAATISSAMAITYTASQAINFFIAMCLNTNYMIGYHFIITFAAIIALVFSQHSEIGIWILAVSVGFGFSLLYPGILGSIGTKLEITNRIGTVIWFISGAFNFVPPLILGPFITDFPMIFVIIQIVYLLFSFLCVIVIAVIVKRSSDKFVINT